MKRLVILVSLLFVGLSSFSQHLTSIDNRLRARFSDEYLLYMQQNLPEDLEYFTWFLDNSYIIKDVGPSGMDRFPKLRYFDLETKQAGAEVTDFDETTFNIMEYAFDVGGNDATAYVIGNTGKALVLLSNKDLTEKYNKYRRMHYENE